MLLFYLNYLNIIFFCYFLPLLYTKCLCIVHVHIVHNTLYIYLLIYRYSFHVKLFNSLPFITTKHLSLFRVHRWCNVQTPPRSPCPQIDVKRAALPPGLVINSLWRSETSRPPDLDWAEPTSMEFSPSQRSQSFSY